MSWLQTADSSEHAAVRGQCPECERLEVAWSIALFDSPELAALAQRRLIAHIAETVHLEPPPARERYDSDRPWRAALVTTCGPS